MGWTIKVLLLLSICIGSWAFDYYRPKFRARRVKQQANLDIRNVHIIFMDHLDVGYDGIPQTGLVNNVLNTYFQEYYPRAIKLNADLTSNGFVETFKYTTHPWLVDMYLNCPPNMVLSGVQLKCPNKTQLDSFNQAVQAGVIQWHAGPMNMYYEIMDPLELRMSLNVSARLNERFSITKPLRVLSQRDVPGVTIGTVPTLVENNILGITNGVNSGSAPPKMPPISRWTYGGKDVIFVQTPGGYPNVPGPVPNNPGGLSIDQCRWLPGMTDAMCFAFRTDNSGPPMSYNEVLSNYEILRAEFPNAKLFASSLEKFYEILAIHKDSIPVSTMEVGVTWVQGPGSDPRKMAEYKAIVRVLSDCEGKKLCDFNDARLINASRFLVKLSEHTYALNTAGDSSHWSNVQFAEIREYSNIKVAESSFLEQRNFSYMAMEALGDHPVLADVKKAMLELKAEPPKASKSGPVKPVFKQSCSGVVSADIGFATDGSIQSLVMDGETLIKAPGKVGQLMYRTYNETDTAFFLRYYSYGGLNTGFGKPGSTEAANPQSQWWPLSADRIIKRPDEHCTFDVHVKNVLPQPEILYGSATDYWLTFSLYSNKSMDITMQWFNKTTTRLMESIFLGFSPDGVSTDWAISKVGYPVDPYTVTVNGSQWQQGVDSGGVTLKTSTHRIQVTGMDCGFVAPWTKTYGPTVWPAPLTTIPRSPGITGMAFPIYNNVWNTNFIFWYPFVDEDKDFKARFQVRWTPADHTLRFRPSA